MFHCSHFRKGSDRQRAVVKALMHEATIVYNRCMNELIFKDVVTRLQQQDPALVAGITIPSKRLALTPRNGQIQITSYNLQERRELICSSAFTINKGVKAALAKVHLESEKATSLTLFNVNVIKYMVLDEFQLLQTQTYQHMNGFLKNVWIPATKNVVISSLRSFGKGWFNLQESDQHAYDKGKLKKLFRLIKLVMQDALRSLVKQSVLGLTHALEKCSTPVISANSKEWQSTKLYSNHLAPEGINPLFLVVLNVDEDNKKFTFSTPMTEFSRVISHVFDEGILATTNMLDIEPLIMTHLFWVGTPTLESVNLQEPWVCELRKKIQDCIDLCTQPLKSYLSLYERYQELLNVDIDVYLEQFMGSDKEAVDVKRECERHMIAKENIVKEIPNSVDIGIFHVSCIELRNKLAGKCQKLAEALLELLCTKLREQAHDITSKFNKMAQVLYSRPNGIEDLMEQREFIKTIPETTKSLEPSIKKSLQDWDLLESFNCSLSDSDFSLRWDVYGWPKKLAEQLHHTKDVLDADQQRFMDNLEADKKEFAENISSLQMIVAGFAQHQDIKRTEHIAVEVRKIAKALKESQETANKYNNRERLCNLPITNYNHLHRCIKDFEPYKSLWLTTDEWMKSHKVPYHSLFHIQKFRFHCRNRV